MRKLKSLPKFVTLLIGTIVIFAVWITSVNAQAQLTERSKLALNGIGPIRVGMTVDEASRAAGVKLVKSNSDINSYQCSYFEVQGEPKGISFMVTKGLITRVDISNPQVTTIRGVKVGDPEDKLLKLYPGQIQVLRGLIGGRMNRFTFVPKDVADKNYRIIFKTRKNRVESFRSGQLPQVEYMGGCS